MGDRLLHRCLGTISKGHGSSTNVQFCTRGVVQGAVAIGRQVMEPTRAKPSSLNAYIDAKRFTLLTSDKIKTLARRGLLEPHLLTVAEIQELCGAIIRHLRDKHGVLIK